MGARGLYVGLWLRMGVALLLGASGLVVLLAAEFALASAVSFFLLFTGQLMGTAFLAVTAFFGAVVAIRWLLAIRSGQAEWSDLFGRSGDSDADSDAGENGGPPEGLPQPRKIKRGFGMITGVGLGMLVAHVVALDVLELDPVAVGLAAGAVVVVGFTGWLFYNELRSAGSVRADLEEEYDLVSDPEREHEVQRRVRRLAKQADSPVPDVEVGASSLPRAATVGYRPADSVILVSRGLVDSLDSEQLDAVLAHELAHLLNRDAAVLTALSVPRSKIRGLIDVSFRNPVLSDSFLLIVPVLVVSVPVYVVNRLVVPMVARYREYVADYAAGELIGSHPAMASALVRLDREYSVQYSRDLRVQWSSAAFGIVPPPWDERKVLDGTIRFFYRRVLGTHPPTESRIQRLRSRAGDS